MRRFILTTALVALTMPFFPAMAERGTAGFTVRSTNMRAGPDFDYPTVRRVGRNARINIYGCLNDRSWCDASYRSDRGWVSSNDLAVNYQGRRRNMSSYLGIGLATFIFSNYWNDYYRGRPFYAERSRWERHYYDNYQPRWGPRPNPPQAYQQQNRPPVQQGRPDFGPRPQTTTPAAPQPHPGMTDHHGTLVQPATPAPDRRKAMPMQNRGNSPTVNERRNRGARPTPAEQHPGIAAPRGPTSPQAKPIPDHRNPPPTATQNRSSPPIAHERRTPMEQAAPPEQHKNQKNRNEPNPAPAQKDQGPKLGSTIG